ncbi:hypothetical protein ACA087_00675 [Pseudomonas chlororaphis]|uniref:hypothetical protein n=1 Tax=Pseudomonas chlororaphis TaxID=587753 RepID=UPI00352B2A87
MKFIQACSEFQCLQILHERIQQDPINAGWYMHRAYKLGQGCSITEALELAPIAVLRPNLTVVKP